MLRAVEFQLLEASREPVRVQQQIPDCGPPLHGRRVAAPSRSPTLTYHTTHGSEPTLDSIPWRDGTQVPDPQLATTLLSLVNLAMTFIAMGIMEKAGRKPLMMCTWVGM